MAIMKKTQPQREMFKIRRRAKPKMQCLRTPPQPREREVYLPIKEFFNMVRIERGRVFFDPKELRTAIELAVHVRQKKKGAREKRARFNELREEAELRLMEKTLRHRVANNRKRQGNQDDEPSATKAQPKSKRPRKKAKKPASSKKRKPEERRQPTTEQRPRAARFLRVRALKEVLPEGWLGRAQHPAMSKEDAMMRGREDGKVLRGIRKALGR